METEITTNQKRLTILLWIFIAIALLGFADAAYLTASHYLSLPLPCGDSQGCDIVTNSKWSEFMGIPVALFGALYYLSIVVLGLFAVDKNSRRIAHLASHLTVVGLVTSTYFMVLQFFVIKAICLYCTISAILCLLLFCMGFAIRKNLRKSAALSASDTVSP